MKRNTASQSIGAQMVAAADGSAFTGAVTVYVTGDNGTQALGSVGSGACTHEGNGYHSYAPAQAESDYAHIAFTFIGSGAIPATIQVFTSFPQTGDNFARLGAPAGASVSADIAAVTSALATVDGIVDAIVVDTQDIQTRLPAALVSGRMDASVGAMASNVINGAAFDTTAGSFHPLGVIDQGTAQAATGTTLQLRAAAAFADDEIIGCSVLITGGTAGVGQVREITDYVAATDTATVDTWTTTPTGTITYKVFGAPPAPATPPDVNVIQISGDATAANNAEAFFDGTGYAGTNNVIPTVTTVNGLAANVITAASLAADAGAEIADAVWDEALAGHAGAGSAGEALAAAGTAGDPWTTALPGAYGAGTAGKIIGDNINATISSRASQTSLDTVDGIVDSILIDTAEIGTAGAGLTALATAANMATVAGYLDTEIAAILADTNELQTDWANGGRLDLIADAIKAKTDSLTFTVASQLDANVQSINDVAITGNGQVGTEFGV